MRLSAGRIRAINRALARAHASAYAMRDTSPHRLLESPIPSSYAIQPHTIKVVAVAKPATA
jgi:hypothetical protein